MPTERYVNCQDCGARLGKQNTSGLCNTCANRARARATRIYKAELARILHVYRQAGQHVRNGFHEFLDQEERATEARLAAPFGKRIAARLSANFHPKYIERLWEIEQNQHRPPDIITEAKDGVFTITYYSFHNPNRLPTPDEFKQTLETAIHNLHPGVHVEWLPEKEEPKQKAK